MRSTLFATFVGIAVGLPVAAGPALADHETRYRSAKKYERIYVKKRKARDDDQYAARAHQLDPAGDYKGYPNWARVALSPKYDGGGRRR